MKNYTLEIKVRTGMIADCNYISPFNDFVSANKYLNKLNIPKSTGMIVADVTIRFIDEDFYVCQVSREEGEEISLKDVFVSDLKDSIRLKYDVENATSVLERISLDSLTRIITDTISGISFQVPSGISKAMLTEMMSRHEVEVKALEPAQDGGEVPSFREYFKKRFLCVPITQI